MNDNWQESYEDDGITLGPEDALRREIEKCKSLKLERLKLKDQVEKLQLENAVLKNRNRELERNTQQTPSTHKTTEPLQGFGKRVLWFTATVIVLNLAIMAGWYFLQR